MEAVIPIWNPVVQKLQVTLPKVTDNLESGVLVKGHVITNSEVAAYLATGETTDGDNHFGDSTWDMIRRMRKRTSKVDWR